jgi:hypothetical protein
MMSVRERRPNEVAQQVMPLLLLGTGLMASTRYFTILDNEALAVESAARPVRMISSSFWSGAAPRSFFPLYDYLLHLWLLLTGGNFEWFHLLPTLLFVGGIFLLARAARRWGGPVSAVTLVWLSVFWPFGFHHGRLATRFGLGFFLVGALTLVYLRYLEDQSRGRWTALFVSGAILLTTQFFGLVLVAFLGLDMWLRRRRGEHPLRAAPMVWLGCLWFVILLPFYGAFRSEIAEAVNLHQRAIALPADAAFQIYTLFVSESVAPWHWAAGVPAGVAVLGCIILICRQTPVTVRRLLFGSGLLILLVAGTGAVASERLMLIAPWVLLSVATAIGTSESPLARRGMALTLLVIAGIGWYGVFSRRDYAEPAFFEPWPQLADQAAEKIREGATVIADSPVFFFYLTYALRAPQAGAAWDVTGLLPDEVRHPQVKSPQEWLGAGHPLAPEMVWVRGMSGVADPGPALAAARELDHACGARTSRLMVRDQAHDWKQWLFPLTSESPWRIEVREYDCSPPNSPEILHIPIR